MANKLNASKMLDELVADSLGCLRYIKKNEDLNISMIKKDDVGLKRVKVASDSGLELMEEELKSQEEELKKMDVNELVEKFEKMKRSAILINVGRGPIVDEADLVKALTEGMIAGAGLDVLSVEPMRKDNPLRKLQDSRKLVITPHIAWASVEARQRLADETAENIRAWMRGEKRNVV